MPKEKVGDVVDMEEVRNNIRSERVAEVLRIAQGLQVEIDELEKSLALAKARLADFLDSDL